MVNKEAYYYTKSNDKRVNCALCPHECSLGVGHYGICKSRQNINGTLIATSYGKLCSIGVDPIEKKPLMQFMSGTLTYSISSAGCNLRCLHCQNDSISQFSPDERNYYQLTPNRVVENAILAGCKSISYTYTEPTTFYEFMIDTAMIAKEKGLKNIAVSNGFIKEGPLNELCRHIDAFNIDLKFFSNDLYAEVSKGRLDPVLNTLKIIISSGSWLEITNLIIPAINDSPQAIEDMCKWLVKNGFSETPLHFSRFYPRYQMFDKPWTPVDSVVMAREIAHEQGIKNVYLGNV